MILCYIITRTAVQETSYLKCLVYKKEKLDIYDDSGAQGGWDTLYAVFNLAEAVSNSLLADGGCCSIEWQVCCQTVGGLKFGGLTEAEDIFYDGSGVGKRKDLRVNFPKEFIRLNNPWDII